MSSTRQRRARRISAAQSQTSLYGFRRHLFGVGNNNNNNNTHHPQQQRDLVVPNDEELAIDMPTLSLAARYHLAGTDGITAFCSKQPIRPLWEHQCSGARFMEDRFIGKLEPANVRGGGVLDDMRMGKSGTCIAFMMTMLQRLVAQGKPRFGCPSIVIGTKDSAPPWEAEIHSLYGKDALSVKVITTDKIGSMVHAKSEVVEEECLHQTDIIITTYGTLSSNKSHVADIIRRIPYRCIILDEAHKLWNIDTDVFRTIEALRCESRWLVTGTPIQNDMRSLVAGLRLLGVHVNNPKTQIEEQALVDYFSKLCIRRVSPERMATIDEPLPWTLVDFTSTAERRLYEHFLLTLVNAKPASESQAGHQILRALSFLSVFCISPYLCEEKFSSGEIGIPDETILLPREYMKFLLDPTSPPTDDDPMESVDFYDRPSVDTEEYYQQLVIEVAARELFFEAIGNNIPAETIYEPFTPDDMQWIRDHYSDVEFVRPCIISPVSHKERHILKHLLSSITDISGEKVVIFSNRLEALDRLALLLDRRLAIGVPNAREYVYIHGATTARERNKARERFSTDPKCGVLLSTKRVNSEGIDLTCANHVVFVDPWWNPTVEHQGNERVSGSNQTRQVHTHRLITPRTIDDQVAWESDKKLTYNKLLPIKVTERQLAQKVLQEAMRQSFHHHQHDEDRRRSSSSSTKEGVVVGTTGST